MPAVTVADPRILPALSSVDPSTSAERDVVSLTDAPGGFEGEGFPVRRAFAGVEQRRLDPFIHMDQMGEVDYGPGEPKGTSWHPHRGFETVTYMIDGVIEHQDSTGGGGVIADGATQWMTAGSGLLHIERPPEALVTSGGRFHGVQLWVNLPAAAKWVAPRYQDIGAGRVVLLGSPDGGAVVRLVAGDLDGHRGPGTTHTPITYVHATVAPGARLVLPWSPEHNALVYTLAGRGTVGTARHRLETGRLAVLGAGDHLVVDGDPRPGGTAGPLELLVLGGRPIGEPVAWYGPFVMNTRAELVQAVEDFQAGRMGVVPPGA